jgi:uncharacterized protein with PQ loop repeat
MIEMYFIILGIIGLVSRIPQILLLKKKKESGEHSLWYWGVMTFCFLSWTWYGFYKESASIVFSNAVALGMNIGVMILILKYRRQK